MSEYKLHVNGQRVSARLPTNLIRSHFARLWIYLLEMHSCSINILLINLDVAVSVLPSGSWLFACEIRMTLWCAISMQLSRGKSAKTNNNVNRSINDVAIKLKLIWKKIGWHKLHENSIVSTPNHAAHQFFFNYTIITMSSDRINVQSGGDVISFEPLQEYKINLYIFCNFDLIRCVSFSLHWISKGLLKRIDRLR